MKKVFLLLFILMSFTTFSQVNVVGYIQTNGVANYPTHIDSMGKGGYMVVKDTNQRNSIPCLRRKYGMAVYSQVQNILYILKDSNCNNIWTQFTSGNGSSTNGIGTFGSFYDSTTQTITSTTTAYPIKITKTDTAYGFHITNNRIIADSSGLYNLQWSGQFQNTGNAEHDATVWIRKNGVNVAGSSGYISIPKGQGSGIYGHTISSWNYIMPMSAGDSITFYWQATNTGVSLQYYPQQTSPTRPSTASVIATITPVFAGTITGSGGGGSTSQTLQQVLQTGHDLTNGVNTQGTNAGAYNSGTDVNAFGTQAAYINYGNSVNAIGSGSANGNLGSNVNAFGNTAGLNNKFSNVTLLGEKASADSTNQMVFSLMKEVDNVNKNARIDFNCINNDRKFSLPNSNGYFMIAKQTQIKTGGEFYEGNDTIFYPGNYEYVSLNDDKANYNLYLPNPTDICLTDGQRLIITNIATDTGTFSFALHLDQTYPIYYKGTSFPVTTISPGETAEFYSDGVAWRKITPLTEPIHNVSMDNMDYVIPSTGTYNITFASNGPTLWLPVACDMDGSSIIIRNAQGAGFALNTISGYANCPFQDIINWHNNIISSLNSYSVSTFMSINGQWVQISEQH